MLRNYRSALDIMPHLLCDAKKQHTVTPKRMNADAQTRTEVSAL